MARCPFFRKEKSYILDEERISDSDLSGIKFISYTIFPELTDESVILEKKRQSRRDAIGAQKPKNSVEIIKIPKDPEDEKLIKVAMEKNDFLGNIIKTNVLDEIIASMYKKEISANEIVIKQGDKGSRMFVSAKERYQTIVNGKHVEEFCDVRVFGELAILYNVKRRATIKAVTFGHVWVLDQHIYQQIVYNNNVKEEDEIIELLLSNEILKNVGKEVLQAVSNLLMKQFFPSDSTIVKQGDKANTFYIIRAGTVTVTKDGEGEVGSLKKGDYFGELALLKEDARQATVTANPPGVECLCLTRQNFNKYFGDQGSLIDAKIYNIKNASLQSVIELEEYADVFRKDLKIIATIGVGGFGRVKLVQHKKKKDRVFALKCLKKAHIVLENQQEHVLNEKKIQMSSRSPFIVRMYKVFKNNKFIYFLLEPCLGGDIFSLLHRQKDNRFNDNDAKFICGCVLEALEYLHTRGIIYRDIKPENLLISSNGYIKLADLGFAKYLLPQEKTNTFAGTPEYIPPELTSNKPYNRAVDYWSFGILVFEMLSGKTPFRSNSDAKTFQRIQQGIEIVVFPSFISSKAKHLILNLCRQIPAYRLGMQKGGIKDIKSHKWYSNFDWYKLEKQELPSSFKPKLKSSIDTSYFDVFREDNDVPPDEKSGWDINL